MSQANTGSSVGQAGSNDAVSHPGDIQELLADLNRQYLNRGCWRKLKDWWSFPKGHRQIEMDENRLSLDQYLLLKIHQLQIDEAARAHQLSMVTWLLVVVGFVTLIVVLIK